jgi:hypothetical protein
VHSTFSPVNGFSKIGVRNSIQFFLFTGQSFQNYEDFTWYSIVRPTTFFLKFVNDSGTMDSWAEKSSVARNVETEKQQIGS